MNLSNLHHLLLRTTAVLTISISALASIAISAQADYVPPGGEPPTGRTSTSGMRR